MRKSKSKPKTVEELENRKRKTYLVFIDNSGQDTETEYRRMTGEEIRNEFKNAQYGIAIVDGNLLKGFDTKTDLTRL